MPRQTLVRRPRKRKVITAEETAIGQRLRAIRLRRGKTQSEVAAAVGIKQPVLSECEHGEARVHGALLSALAKALSVSADEILGLRSADITEPKPGRLMRRLKRIADLPTPQRRMVLGVLDSLLKTHGQRSAD